MVQDVKLKFRAAPRLLCVARGAVRGFMENLGFNQDCASEVVLAVDEACTNAIRHAYEGRLDGILELAMRADEAYIEFELRDHGQPAVKERIRPCPIPDRNAATVQPGGLGMQLIRQVFDEVDFRPGRLQGNRITMRIRRPPKLTTEAQAAN